MNDNHVSRMALLATDPAQAFGPRGVPFLVGAHTCRLWCSHGWRHVQDDAGAVHDFPSSMSLNDISAEMMAYYGETH